MRVMGVLVGIGAEHRAPQYPKVMDSRKRERNRDKEDTERNKKELYLTQAITPR